MFKIIRDRFSKRKRLAKKQPEILRYEELEQRVLFSADVVPGLDTAAVEEQVIVQDVANEVQVEREAASETVEQTSEEKRSELVLVNENVADHEQLIADLQGSDNNRIIEVVVLESDRDGIEQVSEILSERSDLAAVHVITHGSDGQINLGDSWLNSTTLQQNRDAVAGWGKALTESGDILIYGCNIAADSDGQGLLDDIADLTGADVAASDDPTGSSKQGGDWDLEYAPGTIDTRLAVSSDVAQNWSGLLAAPVANNDGYNVDEDNTLTVEAASGILANDSDSDGDPLTTRLISGPSNGTLVLNPVELTNETNLTNNSANDREADWSPDATKIAFRSDRNGNNDIWVMDADGSNLTQLTMDSGFNGRPVWSPDGTKIAFNSDRDGYYEIYVMNSDGTNQTNLTNNAAGGDIAPSWSPDGTKIAFNSDRDGNDEIYVINADGTNPTNLTNNAAKDSGASWSPDGSKILFVSDRDGNSEIYVMDADGSNPTRLTNNVATDSNASWSPDGTKILFKSDRDGNNEIYAMDADGSNPTRLTDNTYVDGAPTWSPDGSQIAFQTSRDGNHEIYVADFSSDGGFTYTPDADFNSTDSFTYVANDGTSDSNIATVTITVNPVNDAPSMTAWFNDAWDSRKSLIINSASVAGDLTGFPVLITLNTDPDLAAQALSSGDDILFTAADGTTQLAHEIEYFDETTGELRVWVKTDLSASADTNIYMYFGNDAASNQENIPGVWDNYVGVYHLSESPTGAPGELVDSSGSGNHSTTEGSMDAADSVATTIGQGLAFDGSDDMIRITDSVSLDSINDAATFSLWINFVDAADGDTQIIMSSSNRYSGWDGYEWAQQNDGDHFFYPDAMMPDTNYNLGANPFTNGDWHHLAATMDFATKEVKVYVDGTSMSFSYEGVPVSWTSLTSSDDLLWGGNPDRATRYFLGMMDEIRIADVVRSQEWIQTEVNNQSVPGTFFSLGVTEDRQDKLTNINEDDFNSLGDTVLSIINSSGADRIMDSDTGALEGIAIIAVDDTNGEWQYDANADGTWVAIGAVSDTNAVLLDTGALIRFVPDADYNGSAGDLIFHAWDQTSDANGNTGIDISTNGGNTAFSSEAFAASLNVNPVNDAPVLGAIGSQTVDELATLTFTVTATDVDIPADTLTFSLDAASIALGMSIDANTGVFSWTPTELQGGITPSVTVTVTDSGIGNLVDSETFTITVNDINVAPIDLQATQTVNGGLCLNENGGNDLYLVADDGGTLLGGLTTVTVESSFSITTPAGDVTPLLSYADGTNDEELGLFIKNDGRIWFMVHSQGAPYQSTSGSYAQLFDGEVHHVGVSWDASNGAVAFYVDGQEVESFTGYQAGQTINGGGELVFGQDQDSVLGGFVTTDVFSGTLYDVRIFNDVRTAPEIAANYDQTLPNTEPGMIANWTFSDLSTGVVLDTVSGNNLTEQHVSGPGFTASTPELSLEVWEDALHGTVIGSLTAADPDSGDTFTYTLLDDAGGRFSINASNGQITLVDSSLLDFESATSHNITARVTDSGGLTYDEVFTINVLDANEFSPVANDATVGINEDAADGTSVHTVVATDQDATANLTYSIIGGNADGVFTIDTNIGEITIADNTNLDRETTASYGLTVQISDGTNTDNATITVNVGDINEFVPVANDATVGINEDAANGASVHTVVATDQDATANLTFSIIGGNADGVFTIDANTGEITISDNTNLDRETTASYGLIVQVSDGTNTDNATITVNVGDINEFMPVANDATVAINEDVANGTSVHTVAASDADATANLTYAIIGGNADDVFTIDANTGEITIADNTNLDRETTASYGLTVQVSDGTNTDTATITVNVGDVDEFDVGPVTDSDVAANTVAEDAIVGTAVGVTALATDADVTDNVTYSLSDDAGGRFAIDVNTGVITVNGALDYETNTSHSVTVLATSNDTSTSSQAFTINVTDINESAVGPVTDSNAAANTVTEDAIVGTTVGLTGLATDADGTGTVTYSLSDDAGGLFTIDANTGVITVTNALDYETATSHSVTVLATSSDTSTSSQVFTINVTDINESAVGPVTDNDGTANTVAENALVGDTVGIIAQATDPDGTDTVTYSLSDDAGGLFTIDSNTGVITVANALDYETATSLSVTVLATSSDTSTSSQAFTINVTDINEFAVGAVTDSNAAANTVAEDAIIGTTVGITGLATDPDGTDTVTYSLSDDAGGLFTIDSNTGVITVANALDYETATSHSVTVLATSSDTSTSSQAFTINVTDINESAVGPVADNDGTANTVAENALVGDTVGITALATDADGSDTVTYSLSDDAGGLFTIDANTGVITVANALDYETATSHSVTVLATSSDTSTSSQAFTINVTDINESGVGPVTDSNAAANTVTEDAIVGTTVGLTGLATDADGTDTVTYSLSDDAGGLFTIDSNTGVITVANALDYEITTSHSVTVLATSSDTSTSSQAFTINVTDINESAVGPVTDNNGTANSVAENALVGDTVGITALATDPDAGDTVTYSLSDDAGGLFTIDSNTGVITVANALDYETATSHSVTVLATSSDTSTSSQAFTINVTDINESAIGPVTDSNAAANTVAEDAIVGTTVGLTGLATDPDGTDTVTYSLSDDAGGLFTIDVNTGVITVANALDYETATSHSVTVLATSSDTSTSSQAFAINVTDINESAVGPVTDNDGTANTIAENALVGDTVGITALATDPDGTDTVTYSLSDDAGGLFTIDANTGVITVANALDYETATSHSVTVLATSSDTSTSSQVFTINVTDINESAVGPVTDNDGTANTVAENALVGDTFGITALATDADGSDTVTYSLSDDAGGLFTIDVNTGVITVANALDYETATSHSVTVLATSSDTSTSSQAFTINVTDINESAVGAVTDSNAEANTVAEDAIVGTTVGITALATDADGTDTLTYSLSDDAGGLFTIDSNTGVITVANALDYETATSHSVTVLATSSDTSTSSQVFTINVTDINESAVGPVTDNDGTANTVAENALVGDTVGITALATDADGSDTVTYSLSDDAGGLFTIDANTGVITVANALDYETATSHSVTVLATSSDTSTSSQAFTINVTDINESAVGPVTDSNAAANTVAEDAIVGTTVGITALATDADGTDTVTYSLSDDAGGLFTIDSNTGVITVANALDYETATSHSVTVLATSSDTSTSSQVFTINVTDINESAVGPVTDNNGTANSVAENALVGDTVGITALATDADGSDTVTYSLSDDAGGLFTIDVNTGVITVANALDYETATSHSVTVLATSSDTSTSSQAFTINVTDINESAVGPVTDNNGTANSVAENALVGDTVGITALATDPDAGDTVTYSLSDDAGGLFTIDSNTGVITVANALDYETATSHSVTVLATSSDTSTSSQAFTINVTDINESAIGPVTDSNAAANTVAEDAIVGTTVGLTGLATDPDGTDTVTYSLSDDAGGLFTIDVNTGVITVANALDYETATSHSVTVLATSSDTSTSSQAFAINVTDINESAVGPVTDNDGTANTIAENALVGDTVGITALATDPDGTDTVTYSLSDDAGGLFTIDANTGVITVANALDYETATSHSVTVLATSSDTSTSSQVFTINVTDINESAVGPVTDNDGTANTVAENALVGDTVGITALATDADGSDTVTYSLSDDAGGLFTIDVNTGVITVANALDYETATSHSVTVLATSSDTSTSSQAFTINVTDINESAVGPVTDSNAAANTVTEDAIVGTTVGLTGLATDADGTDTVTYSLSDDAGGLFTIDSNTGVITVANALDYEITTSHSVTVLATSSDTSTSSQAFTINVTDINESAVGPVTDNNGTANSVAENALVGDTVGITALATDPDAGDTVTYSLSDDAGGLFTIDVNTGVITVANALDYETATSHSVTVLATSSDTSTSSQAFTINVTDINESAVGPVTDNEGTANTVAENALVGDTVGITALATDPDAGDTVTYSLSDDAGGLFTIDSNTGVITVANALDYETATSHSVTVLATSSDTSTSSQAFTINVTDINESAVGPVTDSNAAANTVAEDAIVGTTVSITALATDADGTDTVTYSLSDDAGGLFTIDSNTGVITVANALDYETATSHNVTVLATSSDTSTSSQAFTINVTDVNEFAIGAVTDSNAAANTVAEDAIVGTTVGITALATDPDAGDTVTYSLSDDAGGLFTIDTNTGVISVANALDYETATSHSVTVLATSSDTSTSSQAFTINVTDINESAIGPVNDNDGTANTVAEDAIVGTTVGVTALANDPDGTDTVTYSLSDDAGGLFTIDSNTGVITVANALDYETATSHSVTVLATSSDTSTSSQAFTINVTDINEAPVINNATFALDENSTNGTAVGTVPVTDPDGGDTHVYTITAGNTGGAFAIDNAGNITVANSTALNFETTPVFTLTVQVQDQGGIGVIDTATITVNLNNLNDAPVINNATFALDENSTNGIAVGTVPVTDPDTGDTHVYSITAGNTGGAFVIDNAGNISVANSAALDFETTPVFTLTVQIQDQGGTGLIDTATITVNLNNLNEAPISFGIANVTVGEDAPNTVIDLFAAFADTEDADANLTYTITANTNPGLFAATPIDGVAGNLTLDYAPNANGTANITVRATDTSALWVETTFTVTVNPVNDAPATTPVNLTALSEDGGTRLITQAELLANATDVDGPALTATNLAISTGSGTLVDNGDGTWNYTPAANDDTSVSFTNTITDGSLTAAGSASLDITPVNDAPVTNNDSATVDEGRNVVINLVGNDADVENALDLNSITITAAPANGSLVDNGDGTLTYTHDGSKTISDSFSYTINDVSGATSNIAAVSLTVNPANDNDPADSTDPNPILEDLVKDEDEDSDAGDPTYEAPGEDPLTEDEPLLLVEEYQAPEDSGDADESIVQIKDSQDEETQDIILLTDEIDRNTQSEERDDDRGYIYYDNDLYKDISFSKYLNFNGFAAQNEPVAVSLDDVSFLDFDSEDNDPVILDEDYDALRQEIDESFNTELEGQGIKAKIVTVSAATFTVGLVSYLLRAGSLFASMMSSLPLWRGFDPIAIFSGNKKKKKKQDEISDTGELKPESFFDGDAE